MLVVKRDGSSVPANPQKIVQRLLTCAAIDPAIVPSPSGVDVEALSKEVIQGLVDGISTRDLDALAIHVLAARGAEHPSHLALAARLKVSALHKETDPSFSACFAVLPRISAEARAFVARHASEFDAAIRPERDYLISFFGLMTLEKSYLIRDADTDAIAERPAYLWMRCAVGVCGEEGGVEEIVRTYDLLSTLTYTHATPTLFNAATSLPQLSSCFLLAMKDDSISGIYETLSDCAHISKHAGGIGMSVHDVRAQGSKIRGTGGKSNGLVPMLKVFNETARYVDQGGGKRKGSIAVFLEPWHADVFEFLDLRKNTGSEEARCRDLFLALWTPDLFMRRIESDGDWSLFCPSEAPGLADVHSKEFDALYARYERTDGLARRTLKARELFSAIMVAQIETGTPYILFKDACNAKSNQKHLGTIRSSNLCTEIVEYTSPGETAVCNLASIALPRFITDGAFDFVALARVTRLVVRNLDRVISRNFYPIPEAERSNRRHRPVGLGVQGLSDVFQMLRVPFDSPAAVDLSERIFEQLYFSALEESVSLAEGLGAYETFPGSPASCGKLQFDLWGKSDYVHAKYGMGKWQTLRERIQRNGLRNSLLLAPMPTASTSQILGNTECFEPQQSNLYTRGTLAGDFTVMNARLVADLESRGLWTAATRERLVLDRGSAAGLGLPAETAALYKTVWETSQRWVIDHAAARGPFICQSQSMNLFLAEPTAGKLSSMLMYTWKKGLKTGLYYLRSRPAADAIQFTVSAATAAKENPATAAAAAAAEKKEEEGCLTCGS